MRSRNSLRLSVNSFLKFSCHSLELPMVEYHYPIKFSGLWAHNKERPRILGHTTRRKASLICFVSVTSQSHSYKTWVPLCREYLLLLL
jgi:hypothetical protein